MMGLLILSEQNNESKIKRIYEGQGRIIGKEVVVK